MAKTKLGAFEFRLTFRPADGGEERTIVSTPSMFALADEWADTLRAAGGHTEDWVNAKMAGAIFLLAAIELGLVDSQPVTLGGVAQVMNDFDVDMDDGSEGGGEANPTTTAP